MGDKKIHVRYYAVLREERGCSEENLVTAAQDAGELYDSLVQKHRFTLGRDLVRPAINQVLSEWTTLLADGDEIIFIPPVAGG